MTVAAAEILKLAFNEFIKTSAGETAKKLTGEALAKAAELKHKIVSYFQGKRHMKAEKAIIAIEEEGSSEAMNKLSIYLDDEMQDSPIFAKDIQQVTQQIINIASNAAPQRQYENRGRDQINIENLHGNPRIGGA